MSQTRGRLMFHNKSQSREHIRCERNICSYTRQRDNPFHTSGGRKREARADHWKDRANRSETSHHAHPSQVNFK